MMGDGRKLRGAWLALGAVAVGAALMTGCGGGTAKDSNAVAAAAVATSGSGSADSEPVFALATPQTLPVTPVNIQYDISDPKFDALPGARAIYGSYEGAG